MEKKMGIEGEGPKIILMVVLYLVVAYFLNKNYHSSFVITNDTRITNILALILVIVGFVFWLWSVILLLANFSKGKLIKSGPYAIFLHPIYDSFAVFVLPAIALYLNSDIFFNASAILFLGTITFGRNEEKHLSEAFGEEYVKYRDKVWFKF